MQQEPLIIEPLNPEPTVKTLDEKIAEAVAAQMDRVRADLIRELAARPAMKIRWIDHANDVTLQYSATNTPYDRWIDVPVFDLRLVQKPGRKIVPKEPLE